MGANIDYLKSIDLHGNEVKNFVVDALATAPTTYLTEGRMYYNTEEDVLYYYNGAAFVAIAQGGSLSNYILSTEKGAKGGVATLDESGTVPIAQIPSGNAASKVIVLAGALTEGQVLYYNGTGFAGKSLGTIYTYKGSCTYEELITKTGTAGDVWNVTNAHDNVPAGTNYALTKTITAADATAWDALGGTVDLSKYQLSALVTTLKDADDSHYPSAKAVSDALATKADASDIGTLDAAGTDAIIINNAGVLTESSTSLGTLNNSISDNTTKIASNSNAITALQTSVAAKAAKVTPSDGTASITKETAGTKVTVNTEGIVTKIEQAASTDLSDSAKIVRTTDVETTLSGTSGKIPDSKAVKDALDEVSAGDITLDAASRIVVTDANKKLSTTAAPTLAELAHLTGTTSAIQDQIDGKVAKNADITGATKCKVTYDSKGLVTAGADLEVSDLPEGITTDKLDTGVTASKVLATTASATAGKNGQVAVVSGSGIAFTDRVQYASGAIEWGTASEGTISGTFAHNLGYVPVVMLLDSDSQMVFAKTVVDTTKVTVTIDGTTSQAMTAVCVALGKSS